MASIFTKIINREIPAHIVAEDDDHLAFLDINPVVKGHTLVIPKAEIDYVYDLSDEQLAGLHIFAKGVARAVEEVVPCKRISVAVVGLEVPHAHVHLIPLNKMSEFGFNNPKVNTDQSELESLASEIRQAYGS